MLLSDITFSTETMVVVTAIVTGLTGAIAYLFKMLMDNLNARLILAEENLKNMKNIAEQAITNLEIIAKYKNKEGGIPSIPMLAPVVPEHQSRVTKTQQETADTQTLRARLVAATLALSLPPRKIGEPV